MRVSTRVTAAARGEGRRSRGWWELRGGAGLGARTAWPAVTHGGFSPQGPGQKWESDPGRAAQLIGALTPVYLKCFGFDSQSGHETRLWVQSLVRPFT